MLDGAGDARLLVGRGRELEQLDAALSGAVAGRGGVVVITGDPGIGKTALARAFVERAAARDATWAWGTCWDGGGAPAYWPWVQIARALTRGLDPDAVRASLADGAPWIAGLLPELVSTLGQPAMASDLSADQARFRLFDALGNLLAGAAADRPLVIVLDDLHWADASSVHALEFVARTLPDLPILAIAAYRHSEAHAREDLAPALGGLARAARRLPLEGLGRDDVGRLAAARAHGLGDRDGHGRLRGDVPAIPPRLVAAVHDASAGNPFFVDELVQLLASQGRLHDERAADDPLPLPDGVRDTLRRRLAPLHATSMGVLRAAAVIGGVFRIATIARVTGATPVAVLGHLDIALRAGLVVAADDRGGYGFAHALVRDTLLTTVGATERARLHVLAAEALEDHDGDVEPHLSEIAHHFLQGASEGGAQRAVAYAGRAARRAIGQFAYEEAARLYSRAIEVAAALPADERRSWELHHGLGEALMRAGDVDGSRLALGQAMQLAAAFEDPQPLAHSVLAGTLPGLSPGVVEPQLVGVLEDAIARLDAAIAADPDRSAAGDALRCRLRVQLAVALFWSPEIERRGRLVEEAFVLARAIFTGEAARGSRAQRMLADRTLAFVLAQGFPAIWGPDTAERGLPISVEVLELCERTNDPELAMQVRLWRINLLIELNDPVRADTEIEAYSATARRLAQPRTLIYAPLFRAYRAMMLGEFAAAERFVAEAIELPHGVAGTMAQLISDEQLFFVRRAQGRHLGDVAFLRGYADRFPLMRRWRIMLLLVLAETGEREEPLAGLEELAAEDFDDFARDAPWLFAMSSLAELCAILDDAPRARRLYDLLAPFEGRNVISVGAAYLGPVARYLGLLAMTIGTVERALGHLETARSAAERMGARPMVVLTALDAAEVLVRRGEPGDADRAATLVGRAGAEAQRLQMDGAIARVADLRRRLAPTGAGGPNGARARLAREGDVWLLAYRGRRVWLRGTKGMRYLAALLARPGESVSALALAGDGRPCADADGPAAERARLNVTRTLRGALAKISKHEPELGGLLKARIRTGGSCAYLPDPNAPLTWDVEQ
jgi:tetratricopeptide (TPR) repeat protein